MSTITAYPLAWPTGWKRTQYPSLSRYGDRSIATARDELENELRLMGATDIVISSNLQLRNDGLPRSGQAQPRDTGVAVYFKRRQKPGCFACDSYRYVEDNIWAIVLTVRALRQIDRAGASDMLERAFTGFMALPDPNRKPWHVVLGIASDAPHHLVLHRYRELLKAHHPDTGDGDTEALERVRAAYSEYGTLITTNA